MGGKAPRVSLSHVLIELPASRTPRKHLPHVSHKENASQMSSSTSLELGHSKRKLDADAPLPDMPPTKKSKQPDHVISGPSANATDEHPSGFVYCHQCNKKRDATVSIRCTAKDRKGRRCNAKYCKACLKNRYGLLLEDVLADAETARPNHVHGAGYHFRCPRCDDVCNCVACRKAKGLQPTGNLANAARQSGLTSAADVLRQDPKAAGPMAHKPGEKKTKPQAMHGTASKNGNSKPHPALIKAGTTRQTAQSSKSATKFKSKAPPKPKLLAKPIWTPIGTALSQSEAEERINIREFALRFSSGLDLSRTHLDELDEIRLSRTRNLEEEDEDLIPWVSEACVKSLLLGLLNMTDARGDHKKHLKVTSKSIRESGAHLNKIWAALATLRDWQENGSTSRSNSNSVHLSFPNPLPPPESISIIRTRSGANQTNTGSINVLRTAQLVPVVSALVNIVVNSEAVRQELEAGIQESKEWAKEAREAHRIENERFEQEKEREKGKRLDKSRTEYHKRIVASIDDALKVASYASIPRISPLGRDIEGRTYWALTPGVNERENSLDLLRSYSQGRAHKSKSRRKPLVPSEEDRSALRKWSWFIAVWGKRPPTAERTLAEDEDDSEEDDDEEDDDDEDDDDDDDDEDEEEEEEQWWGFWDPEEITKLASWVHFKAGLEDMLGEMLKQHVSASSESQDSDADMEDLTDDESADSQLEDDDMEASMAPTKGEIETLVKELEQYASLLRGRIKRDEEIEATRPARK